MFLPTVNAKTGYLHVMDCLIVDEYLDDNNKSHSNRYVTVFICIAINILTRNQCINTESHIITTIMHIYVII